MPDAGFMTVSHYQLPGVNDAPSNNIILWKCTLRKSHDSRDTAVDKVAIRDRVRG